MKKLELNQMENLEGGNMAGAICSVGMLGWGGILAYGAAAAALTGGASLALALVWGGLSIALCEAVASA